jgi:hypothetical protein
MYLIVSISCLKIFLEIFSDNLFILFMAFSKLPPITFSIIIKKYFSFSKASNNLTILLLFLNFCIILISYLILFKGKLFFDLLKDFIATI